MADRRMFRYVVPADGEPYTFALYSSPVAVAANGEAAVEFWAEHTEGDPETTQAERTFQVFGTGWALPDGARWVGTCARTGLGMVWHLYEVQD
jgi:hypothetical protein